MYVSCNRRWVALEKCGGGCGADMCLAQTVSNCAPRRARQLLAPMALSLELLVSLAGLGGKGDADRFNALLEQAATHARVAVGASDKPMLGDKYHTEAAANEGGLRDACMEAPVGAGLGLAGPAPPAPALPLATALPLTEEEQHYRRLVWSWFCGLTVDERDRVFTVVDKGWISLLLAMHAEVKRKGDGVFFFDESETTILPPKGKRSVAAG